MKIVIITEYFPDSAMCEVSGGIEALAFNVAKLLAKKHEVTVIAGRTGNSKPKDVFENITVIRPAKHTYSHKGDFSNRLSFAFAAYKTAKKINADIFHGFNFISYLPAYFAAKKVGAKKVATYAEVWIGEWVKNKGLITGILGSIWERFVLSLKWDGIIPISNFTRKKLIKVGIPEKKLFLIPCGVDLKSYEFQSKKFKDPTICCISRLVKTKRVNDLIEALPIIKKRIPKINCKIIGVGDELNSLKSLAAKLGVDKNVEFLGRVDSNKHLIQILKSSHMLCHPSIVEGFGMVVIEAMACGVPYVCSDIDPLVEVTEGGKGGFIFKREDPEDLAEKTIKLLTDKKDYAIKIKEAKKLVLKYGWKNIVQLTEKVYENLRSREE